MWGLLHRWLAPFKNVDSCKATLVKPMEKQASAVGYAVRHHMQDNGAAGKTRLKGKPYETNGKHTFKYKFLCKPL